MEEILLAEHDDDPKFEHISFAHPIKKSVLTIIGKEGGLLMPAGTGFIITPDGLMMTAKHVIEEIYPNPCKYDLIQLSKQYPGRELFALIIESEEVGGLWPIVKVWADEEGTDIALLFLRPMRQIDIGQRVLHNAFRLSMFPPAVDTKIIGAGYYGMTGQFASSVCNHRDIDVMTSN